LKKFWIIAGLFVFLAVMGWGQTSYTWAGGATGAWENENNWEDDNGTPALDYPGNNDVIDDIVEIGSNVSVTISGSMITIAKLTIDSGSTLTLGADLEVSGVLTNNGTLELNEHILTVGSLTNTGTIGLQGVSNQVIVGVSAPTGILGTIHYHGNTSQQGEWVFGNTYTNLTVDKPMNTAGALTVNGNAEFDVPISATSVTVTGTSTMSASVSTTGGTTVSGATTITGMTLAADGTVGMGAVTGASLTVSASGAITLNSANDAATVSLTSTGTGNISYNSAAGVTATASAANGNIAITADTGNITVGAGGISGSGTIGLTATAGSVTGTGAITGTALNVSASGAITLSGANNAATVGLTSTGTGNISYNSATGVTATASATNGTIAITEATGNITVGAAGINASGNITLTATTGNITVGGGITTTGTGSVSLLAPTGNVAINNAITSGGAGTEGVGAAVYINARALTGGSAINLTASGGACAYLEALTGYTGTVTGGIIHYHYTKTHIVYSSADDPSTHFGLTEPYEYRNSGSEYGPFTADTNCNIYIIDVGNITGENPNTFTTSGTGFIEFRGTYTADSVTLASGSGGIRFAGSSVTITLGGAFAITQDLHVQTDSTINATSIELAKIDGDSDLTLIPTVGGIKLSGDIAITGAGKVDAVGSVEITASKAVTVNDTTVTQAAGKTLAFGAGSSLVLDGTASWLQGASAPHNGFYGENGEIIFNAGSTLETKDFYVDAAYTVTLNGAGNIIASGNVEINNTLNGGINLNRATITMNGAASTLKVADDSISLCNLIVAANGKTTLTSGNLSDTAITFQGSVTIGLGATLDCGLFDINMFGDWEQYGTFTRGNNKVEFGSSASSGHTYNIRGDTNWYILACHEDSATLRFSNFSGTSKHTVEEELQISPSTKNGNRNITLTRDTNTPAPPATPPLTPTNSFWHLIIDTDNLELEYVNIFYCFMDGDPIFESPNVTAMPYSSHWNVGWKSERGFLYAYTEDTTHTGKIDRIRLQASMDIAPFGTLGLNDGFKITLTAAGKDYTGAIRNYQRVSGSIDSIYILLNEDTMPYDTGLTFRWEITQNTVIKDDATGNRIIGTAGDFGTTTDTAPPRITYALAVPGHNEIYFQVSENITANPVEVSVLSFTGGTFTRISAREFKVTLGANNNFTASQLASGITFSLNGLADSAQPAVDLSISDPTLPSPKYPENYLYSAYDTVAENPLVYSPANKGYVLASGINTYAEHRATDILISVPQANSADTRYFVLPVWARYESVADTNTSSGVVDFSGKQSMERDDITVQARVNGALGTPNIVYGFNIPGDFKSGADNGGSSGLWHIIPTPPPNPVFVNMVPKIYPATERPSGGIPPAPPPLFNYQIPKSTFTANGILEFFFRLNSGSDLLAGRLDIAAGAAIPADWYRRVKPFYIKVQDAARQRGSVTIFNNVINSEKREQAFLDYKLAKSGRVTVQVFTLDGSLVKVLVRENQNASDSYYRVSWDGTNNGGRPVARGMYFIRIVAPDIDEIRKVMVIK
jgi:hypothetical protein